LVALVDRTIAELTERIELVALREERDLALDAVIAGADVSPDGALRERYDGMATRDQHAALRTFCKLKETRLKHGDCDLEDPPDPPIPVPPGPGKVVPEAPAQSEATVAEVDGGQEEAKCPIDATPRAGEIPNPKSQIPNPKSQTAEPEPLAPWERVPEGRVRAAAPPSAVASEVPEGRVRAGAPPSAEASEAADPPDEDEAIRAAYQARLQRVIERMEQDQATGSAEPDPAARDRPPPGLETSA
jgi:hypothetical protein